MLFVLKVVINFLSEVKMVVFFVVSLLVVNVFVVYVVCVVNWVKDLRFVMNILGVVLVVDVWLLVVMCRVLNGVVY